MAAPSHFVLARNPDPASRLPYLLRLPVAGEDTLLLATRETWPRGRDAYCHRLTQWPDEAIVVEQVPVEACWRSGAAVHLVLRRRQLRRSLFVSTVARGRPIIFWRTDASMRGARPGVRVPLARALDAAMVIAVDSAERWPWRFQKQGATTLRRGLPVGDYAVVDDDEHILAVVERKTVADLASGASSGSLSLAIAELSRVTRAAVVVEGRLSDVVKAAERAGVRPGWLLNVVAALQAEHPGVGWIFAETRPLAEDWAHRWLAACMRLAATGPSARPARLDATPLAPVASDSNPVDRHGPALLDATARRTVALREASGAPWTSRSLARRCGVTQATAWADLRAMVAAGLLVADGETRARTYRIPT